MKFLVTIICSIAIIGCDYQYRHTTINPENCTAAFLWTDNHINGTYLESDPQAAELKIRIMYEQAEAAKQDDIKQIERRVLEIGRQFDQDTAIKVAKACITRQEMGADYRKQRPRLLAMRRALDQSRAAQTNTELPR